MNIVQDMLQVARFNHHRQQAQGRRRREEGETQRVVVEKVSRARRSRLSSGAVLRITVGAASRPLLMRLPNHAVLNYIQPVNSQAARRGDERMMYKEGVEDARESESPTTSLC